MGLVETVTIINKSGKVVSTGKHLVNIFKDAKEAYHEKKAEIKAEHRARIQYKNEQKLQRARAATQNVGFDIRSETSSHRSHRTHRSHRSHRTRDGDGVSRPPLTYRNLSHIDETSSVTSSRRSRSSHHGSRRPMSPRSASTHSGDTPRAYRSPYVEDAGRSQLTLVRRSTYTELPTLPTDSEVSGSSLPPPYTSQVSRREPYRTQSETDLCRDEDIDMDLAYGKPPPELEIEGIDVEPEKKQEIEETMGKLDAMLLEAECLQHSASAIINNLQENPEAMAAVALTLAELSNLLVKMSPAILSALKAASPAIFGLLASPQFLIAGGVALGVTIVMFGGYKIIKSIQNSTTAVPVTEIKTVEPGAPMAMAFEAQPTGPQAAMIYDGTEMGSIDTWRRGIADIEAISVATSADGELITPEAARQRKERIKERKREERHPRPERTKSVAKSVASESVAGESVAGESVTSESTVRTHRKVRRVDSESTIRTIRTSDNGPRPWDIPPRRSSRAAPSESGTREKRRRPSEPGRTEKSKIAPSESGKTERSKVAPSESGKTERSSHTHHRTAPSEAGTRVSRRSKAHTALPAPEEKKKSNSLKALFKRKDKDGAVSEVGTSVSRRTSNHVPLLIDI